MSKCNKSQRPVPPLPRRQPASHQVGNGLPHLCPLAGGPGGQPRGWVGGRAGVHAGGQGDGACVVSVVRSACPAAAAVPSPPTEHAPIAPPAPPAAEYGVIRSPEVEAVMRSLDRGHFTERPEASVGGGGGGRGPALQAGLQLAASAGSSSGLVSCGVGTTGGGGAVPQFHRATKAAAASGGAETRRTHRVVWGGRWCRTLPVACMPVHIQALASVRRPLTVPPAVCLLRCPPDHRVCRHHFSAPHVSAVEAEH